MKKLFILFFLVSFLAKINSQTVEDVITNIASPVALEVYGNFIYVSQEFDKIYRFDYTSATPVLEEVLTTSGGAYDLEVVGDEMYFSDWGNYGVSKFDLTSPNPSLTNVISVNIPFGIKVLDNILYISNYSQHKIHKVDLSQSSLVLEDYIIGLNRPTGMALRGAELYFAEYGSDSVLKVNTTEVSPIPTEVVSGFNNPESLIFNGSDLYISEYSGSKISKMNVDNASTTLTPIVENINGGSGMVIIDNYLYFVQYGNNKISKIEIGYLNSEDIESLNTAQLIYPNPAKAYLYINNQFENDKYIIYSVNGQELLKGQNFNNEINIENLNSGIYIIKFETSKDAFKFIKN